MLHHRGLLVAILAFVAYVATILILAADDKDPVRPGSVTVAIDNADPGTARDDRMRVPESAVDAAESTEVGAHDGQKDETPVGAPPAEIDAAQDQQERLAQDDQLPLVSPLAATSQEGCRSRFIQSHSSRRGVAPRLLVAHITVSPNRPGWSDVDGITAYFARSSTAASSHYVIDAEGHCNYIVRESDKAWTQAAANPVSIAVEIINTGREGRLMDPAGYAKLGRVFADAAKRWEIPVRRGVVNGCTIVKSGIVMHRDFGSCGGGHVDIAPYDLEPVIDATRRAAGGGVTATDRATCRRLMWWRTHGRPHGKPEQNAIRRRRALTARGVVCTTKGPVRP